MGKSFGLASIARWLGLASFALASLGCGGARPLPPYPVPDRAPIEETDLAPYVAEAHAAQATPPSETTATDSSEATPSAPSEATPPAPSEATPAASSSATPPASTAPRARRAPSGGAGR